MMGRGLPEKRRRTGDSGGRDRLLLARAVRQGAGARQASADDMAIQFHSKQGAGMQIRPVEGEVVGKRLTELA